MQLEYFIVYEDYFKKWQFLLRLGWILCNFDTKWFSIWNKIELIFILAETELEDDSEFQSCIDDWENQLVDDSRLQRTCI